MKEPVSSSADVKKTVASIPSKAKDINLVFYTSASTAYSTSKTTCAACKKPTEQACGRCSDAPLLEGDAAIPHYCNAACQQAHWKEHKVTCNKLKDRRVLFRVTQLAQELFYIFSEYTWGDYEVISIEKKGNELLLEAKVSLKLN